MHNAWGEMEGCRATLATNGGTLGLQPCSCAPGPIMYALETPLILVLNLRLLNSSVIRLTNFILE